MAVAVLFTASCTKEDISSSIAGGEVEVTFTANLQDLGSRAYGDAEEITTLRYYVFDKDGNPLAGLNTDNTITAVAGTKFFSVPLVLIKGMTYKILFWADNGGDFYTINPAAGTVTANYTNALANDESRDAFYGVIPAFDPATAKSEDAKVVLKRPFAQLNAITKDFAELAKSGVQLTKSQIVGVIPTTLKVFDGSLGDATEKVTFAFDVIPTDENTTDELTPLSMNYILAPATQKFIADITFSYEGTIDFPSATYTNIPLQRNYKTNIIGKLLTKTTDFEVEILPGFDGTETVNVWDGKTVTKPAYDENTKTYTVTNGAELAWIAAAANGTLTRGDVDTFIGQTIVLANDIELGGHNWTPISISDDLGNGKTFRGTFDGNYKTISGLVSNQKDIAGLFGYIYTATIKNVTVKGASINSNHFAGGIVAWILNTSGNIQIPAIIDNCHVVNSTITSTPELVNGEWDNGDKAGGLVGYARFDDANNERGAGIKNCSVENTTIKAYRDFGGLVGYACDVALKNCSVNNITLEQDLTHDYKAPNTPTTYGELIGRNDGGNTIDGGQLVASGVTTKDGEYYITSAEGFAWIEAQADAFFAGKTIKLANNIDMEGVEYNPIRFWEPEHKTTFDGQDYTISNITIGNDSLNSAALFNGTLSVQNLKIDNATVTGNGYVAVIGGIIYGNIDNCHISNSTVTGNYWQVGGFAGQFNSGNITNCSITKTSITGPSAVGALAGITNEQTGERKFEDCTISGCTIKQNYSFGGDYDLYYGVATGLINISNSTVYFNNCTVENNTIKGEASDTLFGEAESGTTILINGGKVVADTASLSEALNNGLSVVLNTDIDFGSTQLAITGENQVVDLGGHALTTANNWGGISLKNGAVIKNGTITHSGNTAAIKAFNGCSVENVTINATCATADKTVTGIAVQQGANVESIKNVTINGVSQGIEVGYQATVGLIENAVVNESNNGTAKGIGLVINGGKVGKAKDCTFKGETYGITLHLKGVFAAGLELENCTVEGTTASIYAWDEKGVSNTSGSLVLTYDAATTLTGPFVWDFEDECKSVVTLNQPK